MFHRLGLKTGDVLLMAGMILLAVALFLMPFFAEEAQSAQITIAETGENRLVPLGKDGTYTVSSRGVELTVCVEQGQVYVAQSDCRDGICRKTPPISRPGQSIVCAPAGVVIRILGEGAVVDGVSG